MIEAMISGSLTTDAVEREARNGTRYATATARVPAGAEAIFVGLATFDDKARERLLGLRKGAAFAAAGVLEATVWTTPEGEERRGWRLTAAEILSVAAARKRREPAT